MFLTGRAGDPPTALGVGLTDQYTALHIVIAILAALHHRDGDRRGAEDRGRPLLLRGRDAAAGADLLPQPGVPARASGRESRLDLGDRAVRDLRDVRRSHRDRDDAVPRARRGARPALARSSTTRSKRWSSRGRRSMPGLSEHLPGRDPRPLDRDAARPRRVVLRRCRPTSELVEDPQVAHNGALLGGPGRRRTRGRSSRPASPITFSATPAGIRHGVPRSGQHTDEVLRRPSPWEA